MSALTAHLPALLLVIFRIGGLTISAPLFGSSVIPARVRILLVFLIGIAVYPLLAETAPMALPDTLWVLAGVIVLEMAIGVVIGFLASLPMIAVQTGGLIMGQQMGLGFATFFNPAMDDEGDIVGQMLFFMTLAGFLLIGGHEAMLIAVLESFRHIPAGGFAVDADLVALVAGLLTSSLELSLRVAAPLLALIFLESVAMGFIARTVPQLNILSLGFPLRILAGLVIIILGLQVIDQVVMDWTEDLLQTILLWVGGEVTT